MLFASENKGVFSDERQASCGSVGNIFSFPFSYNDHVRRDKGTGAQDQKAICFFFGIWLCIEQEGGKAYTLKYGGIKYSSNIQRAVKKCPCVFEPKAD